MGMFCMQWYFWKHKSLRKSPAVWSLQAGHVMFTVLSYWATLSFFLMRCCGCWLHSIQCNCANTPCCDIVDKLQSVFNLFLIFALTVKIWEPSHWPTVFTTVKQRIFVLWVRYNAHCLCYTVYLVFLSV